MQRPVTILTGAGGGIGSATALELARQRHDLLLTDQNAQTLQTAAASAREAGAGVAECPGDLSDLDFVQSLAESALARFGRIDSVVNNAALSQRQTMRTVTPQEWDKVLRVDLTAPAFLTRWAAADMEKRGKGVIVNISSVQAIVTPGFAPAYVAAKGALDSLTYELAVLYGPVGIRVVAVNPGAIDTTMSNDYVDAGGQSITQSLKAWGKDWYPLRRAGRPQEIAQTVAWLLSDAASYVSGTTILVDGGVSHQWIPYSLKHKMHPNEFKE